MAEKQVSAHRELADRFGRSVDYVRVAVTSRCNLRCVYCLREEHPQPGGRGEELRFGEIVRILDVLAGLGVRKVRFTGGEPLLRSDIVDLVGAAKGMTGVETVSLTTNGVLLDRYLDELLAAGLDGVNVSLDTFDRERYRRITRRDLFPRVEANLSRLLEINGLNVKINALVLRGINTDELRRFVELTRHCAVTVRFMELMPFDDHQIWRTGKFMGADKILESLKALYPEIEQLRGSSTEFFSFSPPGYAGRISIIPAFTRNFCSTCTRLRITSSGRALNCLYSRNGTDLIAVLRNGAENREIEELLRKTIDVKPRDGREAGGESPRTSMSEIGG
ncbi:GTP 3',8-cyclase MoaA [Prosthecochloris sp. GSB1]|uniref:GTP 3',8-cyclase MoaA n=1 Tax=Prosthecochloris sp. GSB1 TaxID=281093 RepID=UPI000B8CCF73|nr:GTP 3',8-cyclase MoaA [Prosthecochloris sp. GSB1]ASQ91395.1 GTP 3',8-cyclase MoaA [Prosthecochloris sp. GSB1]